MPPSRIIIILAVVVLVLFGITLAVSTRTGRDQRAVPQAAWVEALKNVFQSSKPATDELIATDWSVDQAMAFIISGGAIGPDRVCASCGQLP